MGTINFEDNTALHKPGTEVLVTNDRSYRYDTEGVVLEVDREAPWYSYLVSFSDGTAWWYTQEELLAL
jgi:hypothetical protein